MMDSENINWMMQNDGIARANAQEANKNDEVDATKQNLTATIP